MSPALMQRLETAASRMLAWFERDPFGRRLLRGEVTRAEYAGFLAQSYHYVRWTMPLLESAGAQLRASRPALAEAFLVKAREEDGHERWILRDLRALGLSAAEVAASAPSRGVEAYVAWNRMIAESPQAIGLLGTAYVLEVASDRVAGKIAGGLVERSRIPGVSGAVRFLRGHAAADPGHVAELNVILEREVRPEDEEIVGLTGELTALSYLGLAGAPGAAAATPRAEGV